MLALDIGTRKLLLRKSSKSCDTGIEEKLKQFQYWAKNKLFDKKKRVPSEIGGEVQYALDISSTSNKFFSP